MLKLVCFKKLKEDYPDIKLKMELPGGLDINRVTLPIILNCPQLPDQSQTQIQIETDTKQKPKSGGILSFFKSSPVPPELQQPNNLTDKSKENKKDEKLDNHFSDKLPPPRIQRQNTLIESEPKLIESMLSKDLSTGSNVNNEISKETLKVPVTDLFPEKLTEQNYSRRKKQSPGVEMEPRKSSPVRKLSPCLEPHEPVIDSLPAPVPLSPSPRYSKMNEVNISYHSFSCIYILYVDHRSVETFQFVPIILHLMPFQNRVEY